MNNKNLTVAQKLEIIKELEQQHPLSKRALGRKFNVTEGAIRKVFTNRDNIKKRSAELSEETKNKKCRMHARKHSDIEDKLYEWLQLIRKVELPVSPSLTIGKSKELAKNMGLPEEQFKGSWRWFDNFRERKGLKSVVLHGEGAEVNKSDPVLLEKLNELYNVIVKYDSENIYNMDESGLFYRILPKYTLLLPEEDLSTARGKKKAKDRLTMVTCAFKKGLFGKETTRKTKAPGNTF